jgi:hypothetical protein
MSYSSMLRALAMQMLTLACCAKFVIGQTDLSRMSPAASRGSARGGTLARKFQVWVVPENRQFKI